MKINRIERRFVPDVIEASFLKNDFYGEFEAAVLFLDISGFTSTTEELMKNGKEGAEVLSNIINEVFEPSVTAVEKYSGFVSVFAGDAFYAVFPPKKGSLFPAARSLIAASEIVSRFEDLNPVKTRFGNFLFSPKITVSTGTVRFRIIKCRSRHIFYFDGNPFDETACLQKICGIYETLASSKAKKAVKSDRRFKFIKTGSDAFRFTFRGIFPKKPDTKKSCSAKISNKFIPQSVLSKKDVGEFRETVVCFSSFMNQKDFAFSVKSAENLSLKYGGCLNKVIIGDKGAVAMTVFGAPTAVEKPVLRAVRYAFDLRSSADCYVRTGISRGMTYAGFVGSADMTEYTVMGKSVNLSARIMQKAKKGEILLDETTARAVRDNIRTKSAGKKKYKGISEKIDIFSAEEIIQRQTVLSATNEFIGRKTEIECLLNCINEMISSGINGGVVFVDGEPGTGKSQLVSEVLKREEVAESVTIVNLPFESVSGESLAPFVKFLKDYFSQDESKFESEFNNLLCEVSDIELKDELARGKDFLAYYAGVKTVSTRFSDIKPEQVFENFSFAFKALIVALSSLKPVVLAIDDFHCMDSDSVELLKTAERNVERHPFLVIATSRLNDDGRPFETEIGFSCLTRIKLDNFGEKPTKEMLQKLFRTDSMPDKTVNFFCDKTGGNPFYIEQFAMFFLEKGYLDKNFEILDEGEEIPSDINSVIAARLDRLTEDFKETVKSASVLGKEFAVEVLTRMLGERAIKKLLLSGEREFIWVKLEKLRYMFKHILIRDSVYQMILKEKLRNLHSLAGNIIEEIYSDDITGHYRELFDHYDRSEQAEKVVEIGKKARKYAAEKCMKNDALKYFETLDRYLKDEDKIDNRIMWAQELYAFSQYKKAVQISEEVLDTAKESKDNRQYCKLLNLIFNIKMHIGSREDIETSLRTVKGMLNIIDDPISIIDTLDNIAMYYHHAGFEEEGFPYAKKALEEAEKLCRSHECKENFYLLAKNYSRNAVFFGRQIGFDKVFEYLNKALEIIEKINVKAYEATVLGNLGLSYMEIRLDLENALIYLEKALELQEEFQNRNGAMITLNNIALIALHRKDEETAENLLKKAYSTALDIGDNVMQIICLFNLCSLEKGRGLCDEALKKLDKAAEIAEKCGKDLLLAQHYDIRCRVNMIKKDYDEAAKSNRLLLDMSEKMKNEFLLFRYEMNSAELSSASGEKNKAEKLLKGMLERYTEHPFRAETFYAIWKITGDPESKKSAVSLYKKIIEEDTGEYKQMSYLESYKELTS